MADNTTIPDWTLGWRMRRALGHADVSVQEMADELGVTRSTLTRWMSDIGAAPRPAFLRVWAMRTGVDYQWLSTGVSHWKRLAPLVLLAEAS